MKHKENILRLRSEGFTYKQIMEELGCSKGTVSFHCGEGQKDKSRSRVKNNRSKDRLDYIIKSKLYSFCNAQTVYDLPTVKSTSISFRQNVYDRCYKFKRRGGLNLMTEDIKDFIVKIKNTTTCSLTGRDLDINDTDSWHLDHIVPVCKGGENSLKNCQVVCKDVNQAKSGLLQEDFIRLCKDVLTHQGYTVYQNIGADAQ